MMHELEVRLSETESERVLEVMEVFCPSHYHPCDSCASLKRERETECDKSPDLNPEMTESGNHSAPRRHTCAAVHVQSGVIFYMEIIGRQQSER